jgi:hypothetical protein
MDEAAAKGLAQGAAQEAAKGAVQGLAQGAAEGLARSMGLEKLDERQLNQLASSIRSAGDLVARLPKDLHWSEEAAVTFRLPISPRATP